MKKIVAIRSIWILIISVCLFVDCKKQETYDLFPLKPGNEFYYKYYRYRFNGIFAYTTGTETWTVVSESSQGNSNIYTIERKLNALLEVAGQTIIISDSIRYFEISENKSSSMLSSSSMLINTDLGFRRYQNNSQIELKQEGQSNSESWSYLFKADSGLTKYTYSHPPNQITNETLSLDSLKLFL
jgi:hypothetical protein